MSQNLADPNITHPPRIATTDYCGSIAHLSPFVSMREATREPAPIAIGACRKQAGNLLCKGLPAKRSQDFEAYDPVFKHLSGTAQRLHVWICLQSKRYGCAWGRQDALAAHLGVSRRVLNLRKNELEKAGFIEMRIVRRGKTLPTGAIARHETILFYPTTPALRASGIHDPSLIIHDPQDHGSPSETSICDQRDLEEGGGANSPTAEGNPPTQLELPSIDTLAKRLLQLWRNRLAKHIDLDDPRTYVHRQHWVTMIVARLKEGFSEEDLELAIEAHVHSPHNQEWNRRHVVAVFGDPTRLKRMVEQGRGLAIAPPSPPPSSKPHARAKTLNVRREEPVIAIPHIPDDLTVEDATRIMEEIEKEETRARQQQQARLEDPR